jgi:hypothetical protein
MKNVLFMSLLSFALTLSQTAKAAEPLKVFIFAGQSNMVGKRSLVADLPPVLQQAQENVIFTGEQWVPLDPSTIQKKGFGPEVAFTHAMSNKLNEPIGVVKYSKGGTDIAEDWSPTRPDSLYHKLLKLVRAAQASREIEIIGMLWMQGEADSKERQMAEAYAENIQQFITQARTDFASPEMIFICGRVNAPAKRFPYTDAVRSAQENCLLKRYAFSDLDDLPKGTDTVHYTTQGIVMMGHKFSKLMTEFDNKNKGPMYEK